MLIVANDPFMLSVVMPSVIVLNAVAPFKKRLVMSQGTLTEVEG